MMMPWQKLQNFNVAAVIMVVDHNLQHNCKIHEQLCMCSYNCSGGVVVFDRNLKLDQFDDFVLFFFWNRFVLWCRRSILLQFARQPITTRARWTLSLVTSLMQFQWWVLKIESFLEMGILQVFVLTCACVYMCVIELFGMQIKYCTENNKRLIHFSTCEIYGKTIGSFLPEEYRKVVYLYIVCKFIYRDENGHHHPLLDECVVLAP